jgi:hypothetical protein
LKSLAFLIAFCFLPSAAGQTRRVLLVGIDHYIQPVPGRVVSLSEKTKARLRQIQGAPSRKPIRDLDGSVNDVRQMKDLLIRKFHFAPDNIRILIDDQATADHILEGLQGFLVDSAKAGDQSLFYYAGHGSRIRNKSTENLSGMDSTIIPADSLLGVPDIRSKELARIYLQAPKKNVQLTVIQDSCFSGGGARGLFASGKLRVQEPDSNVSVDEKLAGPKPDQMGVLVFSASQDYQPAQEIENTETGTHGAFSWAFLNALETSGENERVDRIFQRTRALMQSKVNDQEPVIGQSMGRNERGLFGQPADPAARSATVAVGFVDRDKKMIELNSGLTLGLYPGCELKRITPASPEVRIRVTEVNGPSSANAAIAAGELASVQPGHLFQMDKWLAPPEEYLRIYTGSALPFSRIAPLLKTAAELRAKPGIEAVDDPSAETPTHILLWNGTQWSLVENQAGHVLFSASQVPTAAQIVAAISGEKKKPRIAIIVPVTSELLAKLAIGGSEPNSPVAVLQSPKAADYALIGRPGTNGPEYAWVRLSETQEDLRQESVEARRDGRQIPAPVWPQRSDWIEASDARGALEQAAVSLKERLRDLARIGGWLRLRTPVPDDVFPYQLALRDVKTKETSENEVVGKRDYKLVLRRRADTPKTTTASRRLYIFVIDSFGKGTLIFPQGGNIGNEFPTKKTSSGSYELEDEIDVPGSEVEVSEPYGIDNYFLLTSEQPIDNPEDVFNFSGARTRSARAVTNPLARLISDRAAGTRGSLSGVPTNWSIERFTFRSVEPK